MTFESVFVTALLLTHLTVPSELLKTFGFDVVANPFWRSELGLPHSDKEDITQKTKSTFFPTQDIYFYERSVLFFCLNFQCCFCSASCYRTFEAFLSRMISKTANCQNYNWLKYTGNSCFINSKDFMKTKGPKISFNF